MYQLVRILNWNANVTQLTRNKGNGSEEIESVAVIDILVRGGATVTVASVETTLQVTHQT